MRAQATYPGQPDKLRWPPWLPAVLFGLAYFAAAELGDYVSFHPNSLATFWPAAGLFVAVLLLSRPRNWPWLVLAAFPANICFDLLHGRPLGLSLLLTCGNSLEALAGAWLVRRWAGPRVTLTSLREVLGLAALSAALSTAVSATVAAVLGAAVPGATVSATWPTLVTWWGGHVLGVLVVAPFVLVVAPRMLALGSARPRPSVLHSLLSAPRRAAEVTLTLAGLWLCIWLVFRQPGDPLLDRKYLLLPFVMWVALRLGLRSLAATNFGLALAVVWAASRGYSAPAGPGAGLTQRVADVQLFLSLTCLTGLVAAGLMAERNLANEALRKREAHFRAVVENSYDGIIMLNAGRQVVYVSPSYARLSGFSPEEWLGAYGPDYIHPDDRAKTAGAFRDLVQAPGAVASVEYRLRHKRGHWFWVETTATNLLHDPHVQAIALNSRDITERKRAQEALRESETRFRALSDNSLAGVYIIQDGHLTYVNASLATLFGYVPGELIGADPLVVVHPDDHALVTENIRRRMADETRIVQYECRGRRKNGETNQIEIFGARIELNERPALIGTLIDITERKRAEEMLQESERTARRLAQQLQVVNQIGAKIAAGLEFEPLMQTLYEQCRQIGDTDTFYIALYDEATGILSFPVNYKDGERRVFRPRAIRDNAGLAGHIIETRETLYVPDSFNLPPGLSLVRQPGIPTRSFIGVPLFLNDRIVGVLSMQSHVPHAYTPDRISTLEMLATQVAIAIHHSRLYEQVQRERNRVRDLAEYLQSAREQERASIAREIHDEFGQSLTALKMDLAWLVRRLPPALPNLRAKVDSMSALVDGSIHTVRRIATELRPGVLDDLGLVAAIEWQADEFAKRTGITCTLRLGDHDLALEPDLATALFRILQESLTNIARHAQAAHVEVELDDQPGLVTMVVRDDGVGIEPAQLSDPRSLGLTGMRERARARGGDVVVEGRVRLGTTVIVRIPTLAQGEERQP